MIWPMRTALRATIAQALANHAAQVRQLPGIADPRALEALSYQILASLRREDYFRAVQARPVSPRRADPNDNLFDAERAVAFHVQQGNIDEAAWLIFLMTHFAKPADSGWLRLRDVYGRLGQGIWDWQTVSGNPAGFAAWLTTNWRRVRGKFGNHRKYESLRPNSARNMGRVVSDYVHWIGQQGHAGFFHNLMANDPFDFLYQTMRVTSFGRLAKFDYLMLLSRYSIVHMAPTSAYLDGATGPRAGAGLLFTGRSDAGTPAAALQRMLDALDADLNVGMAVLEDSLCNWQKSPMRFVHFRG